MANHKHTQQSTSTNSKHEKFSAHNRSRFAARCHQAARYPMGVLAGFTLLLRTLIGRPVEYKYVRLAVCLWE
jgi:hypothetical protein